ncbi:MAG TPA: alpha/beta fold hydrolase [Pyrinomonadaceae bacterium]|jgi:pimeloyl-ACP methyl ester carboxylesterase
MPKTFLIRKHRIFFVLASLLVFLASASAQTPQPARAEKEVRIYGQKIRYVEAGSGPTVILLHGLGGNSANWILNINQLAAKYRVIVPDQVGFGQSDKPLINYRVGTYVDFLDRLYSELKIERATLVGNSMGGWIAALYTIAHPERVERLVLVDAAGFAPPKDFDVKQLSGLNPSTREGMRELASRVIYNKQIYATDEAIDLMLAQRMAAGDGYTIQSLIESIARREDMLDGRLSAIRKPTLLIWGKQDGLTPLAEFGERFKREIAGAELIVFDQCGHVPQVEKAAEFNAALLKFLAAPAPAR